MHAALGVWVGLTERRGGVMSRREGGGRGPHSRMKIIAITPSHDTSESER